MGVILTTNALVPLNYLDQKNIILLYYFIFACRRFDILLHLARTPYGCYPTSCPGCEFVLVSGFQRK